MSKLLPVFFISLSLYAGDYDFNMDALKPEPYEYNGYVRVDDKFQKLNQSDKDYQNYIHTEALFDFSYFHDIFTYKASLMATHDYIHNKLLESDFAINELYAQAKLNTNHSILAGKESLNWGKGYFFNPVAFFDREKDPSEPTKTREGFVITKYSYNKSFDSDLKNISFDVVYLPAGESINKDYYNLSTNEEDSNNLAMRLYLLLYDTDIDIIYNYSDVAKEKIGVDFSKNLEVNFEIHGEYAKVIDDSYSYILGLRYITDYELTIISEYLYQSDGLNEEEIRLSNTTLSFIAKEYAITLITQKEPFDWLYFSVYYKNMLNLQDNSQQNKIGANYIFKNNMELDLSYNVNSGTDLSEYGKKQVSDFAWLKISWNF